MGSENNMVAVCALQQIASIKGDPVSADIANAALARLAQPDAQQDEVAKVMRFCEERAASYGGLRPVAPTAIALDRAVALIAALTGAGENGGAK